MSYCLLCQIDDGIEISNGNRTEWSPIQLTKSDDRIAGVRFV